MDFQIGKERIDGKFNIWRKLEPMRPHDHFPRAIEWECYLVCHDEEEAHDELARLIGKVKKKRKRK